MDEDEVYLTSSQLKRRYGNCSDMALWRWLRRPGLGFPQPIKIGDRRYWKLSDLRAFEVRRATPAGAA